ncbi:hypothetical protein [Pelagibius sp. Alg239-R121]|uniref:hypothetical protein n=1 Tax=Pelagibius sp. Alg239-R121 TaxID=2993448 RepID=UPI0024A72F07|nr:hypothetical protein [Pelagibius sp. Alg239-R121]
MTDNINIVNMLLLFAYLTLFGYLFKLFLFRMVRYALASSANGFGAEQFFAAGNRSNLLLAILSFVLVCLPVVLLIVVPGMLRLFLGG